MEAAHSTSAGSRPTHSCQPGAILASLSRSLSRPEAARGAGLVGYRGLEVLEPVYRGVQGDAVRSAI